MYMISDAANARWLDPVLFRNPAPIRPKTFFDLGPEDWSPLFCTKYGVDVERVECVRHKVWYFH